MELGPILAPWPTIQDFILAPNSIFDPFNKALFSTITSSAIEQSTSTELDITLAEEDTLDLPPNQLLLMPSQFASCPRFQSLFPMRVFSFRVRPYL